jgi:hypothetical protein
MPDPITLSALGATALTEGIKFLYKQAGEVLKRWRERRDKLEISADAAAQTEPTLIQLPEVFAGGHLRAQLHYPAVERLEPEIKELRQALSGYADETDVINLQDGDSLQRIDALRQLLEAVYQQRFSFKGEVRPADEAVVKGRIDIDKVAGYAAAVRAKVVRGGRLAGVAKAKEVAPGGSLIGVDVDNVGG